jgi:hypothetical protein
MTPSSLFFASHPLGALIDLSESGWKSPKGETIPDFKTGRKIYEGVGELLGKLNVGFRDSPRNS